MEIFRLVDPGRVDRIIGFEGLPKEMLSGIRKGPASGLPSNWTSFLGVKRGDKEAAPFYVLDFRTTNRDKEKWQEITNYVRRSTDKNVRLMDNIYDMAKPMSNDSYSSLELDPEDVPIIPIKQEIIEEDSIEPDNETLVKRPGRPKKEVSPV